MKFKSYIYIATLFAFASCGDNPTGEAPPIVMGNPATIVTETDSQYLMDQVVDLKMAEHRPVTIVKAESEQKPETTKKEQEPKKTEEQPKVQQPPKATSKKELLAGNGLKVPFPQVTMFVPNIETRYFKKPNFQTDFGASYEIKKGDIRDNKLIIEGHHITGVYMRYQTIIVARNKMGMLPLESLRKTTNWKTLKGKDGIYPIHDFSGRLQGARVSNRAIRNAVRRDARKRNWSTGGINKWLRAVRNVKSTSQKPLKPELRAVMFKVTGKDKTGRPFQRQLRIDIPIKS